MMAKKLSNPVTNEARVRPWVEALDVSVVAVWTEKEEPLAQSSKPLKRVDATKVRVDWTATVGNS